MQHLFGADWHIVSAQRTARIGIVFCIITSLFFYHSPIDDQSSFDIQEPCAWKRKPDEEFWLWDQHTNNSDYHKSVFEVAEAHAQQYFSGKSILVIGGSTSRSLAADFMRFVLPRDLRDGVASAWKESSVEGYELFPRTKKLEPTFDQMYTKEVMLPLMTAGWNFTHLRNATTSGCRDCVRGYTNNDYMAELYGGHTKSSRGITYEYSWKPEIFSPVADTDGFTHRYCQPNRRYDAVFIGRGLHDAVFKKHELTPEAVDERFRKLAELLKCFPETTLIIVRTPYVGKEREAEGLATVTKSMVALARNGAFGANRTLLLDGHLLTSAQDHPETYDGHHYKTSLHRSVWRLIFFASARFFDSLGGGAGATPFKESIGTRWQECGITVW
eukprot:CAMPEP_0183723348 /NCGR_PEP_ID=MMETSP0737-20130205/14945_1 /TAXON_ID=385413 /ORGANISM="Thalassiosira miniscula, Strain CCMP1093" /LENGTH=385 /DNA_ID=CAMNT_0025953609 /DNA_START=257 /DNA_END=1414 /DNA_ORIENTATION=-